MKNRISYLLLLIIILTACSDSYKSNNNEIILKKIISEQEIKIKNQYDSLKLITKQNDSLKELINKSDVTDYNKIEYKEDSFKEENVNEDEVEIILERKYINSDFKKILVFNLINNSQKTIDAILAFSVNHKFIVNPSNNKNFECDVTHDDWYGLMEQKNLVFLSFTVHYLDGTTENINVRNKLKADSL